MTTLKGVRKDYYPKLECPSSRNRIEYIDWLSGLLIVHMILGHISQSAYADVEKAAFFEIINRLLFFFMPWFFFKSGMFYKRNSNQKDFIEKSYKHLLVPFVVFSLIGEPLYWVHIAFTEHYDKWQWYLASIKSIFIQGSLKGNGPLWFLLSLFLIRVFYNYIAVNVPIKCALLGISVMFLCLVHYYQISVWLSITHTISGLLFFTLGDLMRKSQYNTPIFSISLIVTILIFTFYPIDSYVLWANAVFPEKYYYWIFLYATVAVIVANNLIKKSPIFVYRCIPFQIIGRNAMIYYITYLLILNVCRIIFSDVLKLNNWLYFWIMVTACVVFLPLFAVIFNGDKYKKFIGN